MQMEEIEVFSSLLESGLSFEQCVHLSFKEHLRIEEILEQGEAFVSIVSNQPDRQIKALGLLMESLSLAEALSLFKKLSAGSRMIHEKLLKPCLYPLFIMAFVTVLVWFFSESILPAMADFSSSSAKSLLDLMKLLLCLFWLLAAAMALLLCFLNAPGLSGSASSLLFRIPIVRSAACAQCALFFESAGSSSLSTSQLLSIMESRGLFLFSSVCARRWKTKMKRGESLEEILCKDRLLDEMFVRCFELGLSGNMEAMMGAYVKTALMKMERTANRFSSTVLLTSYSFVGVLALCVYQIMLEPLSILSTI